MIHFLSKTDPKKLRGTALLRLDFNTEDSWRLEAAVPTVRFLMRHADAVLIVSHKGRPPERGDRSEYSLRKDARTLSRLIGKTVRFFPHLNFSEVERGMARAPKGSVFLMENIRFDVREAKNEPVLGKALAGLADYYVNDAFAVSHRANASLVAVTNYLPSYAGLLLEKEIAALSGVLKNPKRPFVVLVGGGKAHDKLEVLKTLRHKADTFFLGGAPANTILALRGVDVGASLRDDDPADLKILRGFADMTNVITPMDWKVGDGKILDIGPKAARDYAAHIAKAKTILWAGPMGYFEKKKFAAGNLAVARAVVANRRAFSLTGGGETVTFLKKYKLDRGFSFISTGGGAMLEFLAGKKLPGIEALKR